MDKLYKLEVTQTDNIILKSSRSHREFTRWEILGILSYEMFKLNQELSNDSLKHQKASAKKKAKKKAAKGKMC